MPLEHSPIPEGARRELKSRQQPWAQAAAKAVDRMGLTPNMISVISVLFALLVAICLVSTAWSTTRLQWTLLMVGAIAGIQLRLICNLLDGMVAIEGGKKSVVGGLYNEVPDRIADPLIIASAGYVGGNLIEWHQVPLGWVAAVLSVFTAYIRVLGGSLGVTQSFMGPMAKQHRMAILTLACLAIAISVWFSEPIHHYPLQIIRYALMVMVIGCLLTSVRRLLDISIKLHHANHD